MSDTVSNLINRYLTEQKEQQQKEADRLQILEQEMMAAAVTLLEQIWPETLEYLNADNAELKGGDRRNPYLQWPFYYPGLARLWLNVTSQCPGYNVRITATNPDSRHGYGPKWVTLDQRSQADDAFAALLVEARRDFLQKQRKAEQKAQEERQHTINRLVSSLKRTTSYDEEELRQFAGELAALGQEEQAEQLLAVALEAHALERAQKEREQAAVAAYKERFAAWYDEAQQIVDANLERLATFQASLQREVTLYQLRFAVGLEADGESYTDSEWVMDGEPDQAGFWTTIDRYDGAIEKLKVWQPISLSEGRPMTIPQLPPEGEYGARFADHINLGDNADNRRVWFLEKDREKVTAWIKSLQPLPEPPSSAPLADLGWRDYEINQLRNRLLTELSSANPRPDRGDIPF